MTNKSFIVTGGSASGKTTLINLAIKEGYFYLPTHMTRQKRDDEIAGKSAIFLSNEEFEKNFHDGEYLEESLDFAKLHSLGVYYGTPKEWTDKLKLLNYCASPVSIKIARAIKIQSSVLWVHLFCDDNTRYQRLMSRGISEEEIILRMTSGDSISEFPSDAEIIDTSKCESDKILKKIRS